MQGCKMTYYCNGNAKRCIGNWYTDQCKDYKTLDLYMIDFLFNREFVAVAHIVLYWLINDQNNYLHALLEPSLSNEKQWGLENSFQHATR